MATPSEPLSSASHVRLLVMRAQARFANTLGVSSERRTETVAAMLESNARRAPGFWLQLFLATGIATLGLALGSTAVVIGGMLVSPLMGPIVELGMGFAVGSSLLVIRAFLRVLLSVAVVVAFASLITVTLPFHEINPEIAARTAPTLLDLLIAVFCALAAAYTTVRQTADTTAAAAGTAIGIALVPPLCVVGYGLGTMSAPVASGAALLFTANFSAILVVAVLSFLVLGFNQVEASSFEHDYLETTGTRTDRAAARAHRALRSLFGSRYGLAMRLLVPALVLASVAVPLKRALDEVAWEVRVREGIRRLLDAETSRAVQSALTVERNTVAVRLLVIGSPEEAAALERRLALDVASLAGVVPTVAVTAVPDADVLRATLAIEARAPAQPLTIDLAETERQVAGALSASWPTASAGPLLGWSLELGGDAVPRLTVRHLGEPLGASAEEMLSRSLAARVRPQVRVLDAPLPATWRVATGAADSAWLGDALDFLAVLPHVDSAAACVTRPRAATSRAGRGSADAIEGALRATDAGRSGRVSITEGDAWAIRVVPKTCPEPDSLRP